MCPFVGLRKVYATADDLSSVDAVVLTELLPPRLGVVRAVADPDNISAEFAIIVRSDLKGKGLGTILMAKLIDYCRSHGTREITGDALSFNAGVLNLVSKFGFEVAPAEGDSGTMHMRLQLAG